MSTLERPSDVQSASKDALNKREPEEGNDHGGLPCDVWKEIVAMLDTQDLKNVRFCNKWFDVETRRHLFTNLTARLSGSDMEQLIEMSHSKAVAPAVKTLVVQPKPGLPAYTFEEWRRRMSAQDGDMGRWMSTKQARHLYQTYQQERDDDIWGCMIEAPYARFRGERSIYGQWTPKGRLSSAQRKYLEFDEALLRFENLQEVVFSLVDPFLAWRHYSSVGEMLYGRCPATNDELNHQAIAAVAFTLRGLGWSSAFRSGLISLRLEAQYPDWTWDNLSEIWRTCCPQLEMTTCPHVDMDVAGAQIRLLGDAFVSLTNIDLQIKLRRRHSLESLTALGQQLSGASQLKRLRLHIQQTAAKEADKQPPADVLDLVTSGAKWPFLEDLELSRLVFTVESLLRTLSKISGTLAKLAIESCTLKAHAGTWPEAYKGIRSLSLKALRKLRLEHNFDIAWPDVFQDPRSSGYYTPGRQPADEVWHVTQQPEYRYSIRAYGSNLYDYILRKTDAMPPYEDRKYTRTYEGIYSILLPNTLDV
ncbi:hypothetical protein B0J12DRAFT_401589 [Macrophomina phaseolina]|uniref:F-box domain-containing protein n=1 Tax=Macrophomina phaseolina TaxID=35725 RepID=A0ABQ8GL33_9PEZI|nr:hypothetical protein B0J12DRAFT_401589 [Macrophomina phaseolina]